MKTMRLWGFLLIAVVAAQPAWAKMFKWVDAEGKTHYGDTIPPQYAGQGNTELSKKGMVVNKTDAALTEDQRREKDEGEARQRVETQKALDVERRDKALINTYTNEKEIDLARDRHLQAAGGIIKTTEVRIKSEQARLDGYRKQTAGFAARNKPVPQDIANEMKEVERELQHLQDTVKQKQQEQAEISAKFEADKERFRELTKGTTAAKPAPLVSAGGCPRFCVNGLSFNAAACAHRT
jgi:hypothetical protein